MSQKSRRRSEPRSNRQRAPKGEATQEMFIGKAHRPAQDRAPTAEKPRNGKRDSRHEHTPRQRPPPKRAVGFSPRGGNSTSLRIKNEDRNILGLKFPGKQPINVDHMHRAIRAAREDLALIRRKAEMPDLAPFRCKPRTKFQLV